MNDRHRPLVGALVGVLVAVLVVAVLVLMVRTWTLADAIRESQKSNTTVLKTVNDCTQPHGKCYQRGQKQTATAVGNINRVVILAAACSVGLDEALPVGDRQARIQACVIDGLASK